LVGYEEKELQTHCWHYYLVCLETWDLDKRRTVHWVYPCDTAAKTTMECNI
jgi:hypothetical protein